MPTGYNNDGSKKVRPAGSGRKKKESKAISPQISLAAAAVLAGLKKRKINQNDFISQAILEKAANDASKRAAVKIQVLETPGQVDLVEMLQEIRTEKQERKEKRQAKPEPKENMELIFDNIYVATVPIKEFTAQANVITIEDYKPIVFLENTSELSKPSYLEERKSKAYAMLLLEAFAGAESMNTEDLLAKIMRKRRKGKVDALEVLLACVNMDHCTNNAGTVKLIRQPLTYKKTE